MITLNGLLIQDLFFQRKINTSVEMSENWNVLSFANTQKYLSFLELLIRLDFA